LEYSKKKNQSPVFLYFSKEGSLRYPISSSETRDK